MERKRVTDAIKATLSDLIAIPSVEPPGDTTAVCAYTADRLAAAGCEVETLSRAEGVANLVGRMGEGKPSLVFNVHADTVDVGDRESWLTDPFVATEIDGNLHGLGAANCKGSIAVMLWLAERIARDGGPRDGEVVFTVVGDEERLGPDGLAFLRETGAVRPDYLIVGAPTQLQAIAHERGVFWSRLTARGRAAHAGDPRAGDNAILRMLRLIETLRRELEPRLAVRRRRRLKSTMNIGTIRGGHNTNSVPSECILEIDRRVLPEERVDEAFAEMEAALATSGEPEVSYTFEFLKGTNGFASREGAPCITAFHRAIERVTGKPLRELVAVGASDGRYFAEDGIEILTFGPGAADQGHAANEWVPLADLALAAEIQLDVVDALLGLGQSGR